MKLQVGGIYLIDTRNVSPNPPYGGVLWTKRVLIYDDCQVYCDAKWENETKWWFDRDYKTKHRFNRAGIYIYEKYAEQIDYEPLDTDVLNVLRPDLPLATGRIKDFSWNDDSFSERNSFVEKIDSITSDTWKVQRLKCPSVFLEPMSKNDIPKKPVLIHADNGGDFSMQELLWKAKAIRDEVNKTDSSGVGIFRDGVKKGVPVFYIGSYYDLAGSLQGCANDKPDGLNKAKEAPFLV